MKILNYFVLLCCIAIASCASEVEEVIPENAIPQSSFLKEDILSFTKGKATKEGNSLVFVFKNKKNESITITTSADATTGVYTDKKGTPENIYTANLAIDSQKKEGYTSGTLTLVFSEGASPLEIKFYNLPTTDASGDFYEADFLSLPVTWTEDADGRFIEENYDYDSNARISKVTSAVTLKTIDVKINSVEKFKWNNQGKIEWIDYKEITEVLEDGELTKTERNGQTNLFYDEDGVLIRSEWTNIPAENPQARIPEVFTTYDFDSATGWIKSKNETWFTGGVPDLKFKYEYMNDSFGNIIGLQKKEFTVLEGVETIDSYTIEVLFYDTNKPNYKSDIFAGIGGMSQSISSIYSYLRGPSLRTKRRSETFDATNDALVSSMEISSSNFDYDPITGFPTRSEDLRIGQDKDGNTNMDLSLTMSYKYQLALVFRSK